MFSTSTALNEIECRTPIREEFLVLGVTYSIRLDIVDHLVTHGNCGKMLT